MSDTPRTDACIAESAEEWVEFAKKLERENAKLRSAATSTLTAMVYLRDRFWFLGKERRAECAEIEARARAAIQL